MHASAAAFWAASCMVITLGFLLEISAERRWEGSRRRLLLRATELPHRLPPELTRRPSTVDVESLPRIASFTKMLRTDSSPRQVFSISRSCGKSAPSTSNPFPG
eukprot:3833596-Rhodomonas_salina.1